MGDSSYISGQSYEPLRRLLSNDRIEALQTQIKVKNEIEQTDWEEKTISLSDLETSDWEPQLIIAIDGDHSKSKIYNGFPGAEVGYITACNFLVNINVITSLNLNLSQI